jgi:glucokinase, proteobacterial type
MPDPLNSPVLLADIGGTNARFALLAEGEVRPGALRVFRCADFPDIVSAVRAYLEGVPGSRPVEAVVAIANPVTGDVVRMTNHAWSFSIEESRRALGLARLRVVNDFEALAMALPGLSSGEYVQIGGGSARDRSVIGLIGPGTGLGVSGLVPVGAAGWKTLAGEGGHVSFSPADSEQDEILAVLREKHHGPISVERLVSGPGLVRIHDAVAEISGQEPQQDMTPDRISALAVAGEDDCCIRALTLFCAMLGSAAGNLALTLGAQGGIYIGGGIVPKILSFFEKSPFRASFEAKGRMEPYLRDIPTFVITADNPTLLGAAALSRHESLGSESDHLSA